MKKVLIIDDMTFMRVAIRKILEKNAYQVVGEANNGLIGVSMYKELHPDIVTLDITMPEMSGLETLTELRKYDPAAKVVMISAMGQESIVFEAIKKGAKAFIVKPFKEDFVLEALSKI